MEYTVILHTANGDIRSVFSVKWQDAAFNLMKEYAAQGKKFTVTFE